VFDEYVLAQRVLAATLVGYLLGSIPFAHIAARVKGVDIFATGSQTAGTANVFWNISRRTGVVVLVADVAKGVLAVTIAHLLEIHDPLVLLAGAAAIVGHWNSVFTGFRGGDGMATLLGVTIALVPILAILGILVGFGVVLILRRSRFRSAWGLVSCFALMLALSEYYHIDRAIVLGLVVLAAFVIWHSITAQRRRLRLLEQRVMELEAEEAKPDPDLGAAAPENR
jgi:glycerol-3-phosphate acyltransferase PlsY